MLSSALPEPDREEQVRMEVESRIVVRGLTKDYVTKEGRIVRAIENTSFDIRDREFIAVVGPSGCGKTTLLKVLAGISEYFEGEVLVDGRPITRGKATGAGVVFQAPVLLPWRTVLENILLPAQIRRDSGIADTKARAVHLLEMVGLDGTENLYPSELSGGMQQRVSICRALITDPVMLLMDEPFGALDALTRETMNLELQRIWLETGKTVLFITHSIPEAVFLADRVLVFTGSPGSVAEIVEIDIPRPRSLDEMTSARFGDYLKGIRTMLHHKSSLDE